ncbi:MAG: hypothetical protein ACP5TY_09840 [Thermodesulforhabdaceae bacterium]
MPGKYVMVQVDELPSSEYEQFKILLEECLIKIDELKNCTRLIAESAYEQPEDLEKLIKRCQILRIQVDKSIEKINELSITISKYFDYDDNLRSWYNLFRERLKEAQDITFRAMHSLKVNMEKLDNDMVMIRQKHRAIKGYEKHR